MHNRSHFSSDEESHGVGIDESPEVAVETTSTSLPKTKRRAAGNKYNSFSGRAVSGSCERK